MDGIRDLVYGLLIIRRDKTTRKPIGTRSWGRDHPMTSAICVRGNLLKKWNGRGLSQGREGRGKVICHFVNVRQRSHSRPSCALDYATSRGSNERQFSSSVNIINNVANTLKSRIIQESAPSRSKCMNGTVMEKITFVQVRRIFSEKDGWSGRAGWAIYKMRKS